MLVETLYPSILENNFKMKIWFRQQLHFLFLFKTSTKQVRRLKIISLRFLQLVNIHLLSECLPLVWRTLTNKSSPQPWPLSSKSKSQNRILFRQSFWFTCQSVMEAMLRHVATIGIDLVAFERWSRLSNEPILACWFLSWDHCRWDWGKRPSLEEGIFNHKSFLT